MKRLIVILVLAMLVFNISDCMAAALSRGESKTTILTDLTKGKQDHDALIRRVYEIRDMDKSNLSFEQKFLLREELNGIKTKLGEPGFTGLYLSSGVIIIILIILLILALSD